MAQIEHHRVSTNGIELHVAQTGPLDGPLALLLHGFPESWRAWQAQIQNLVDMGYRVWLPDQRGYNTSDKPREVNAYGIELLCADIAGLIEQSGRERITLMGHDWGGVVAWSLAAIRPDLIERVVIVNAPHLSAMRKALRSNLDQIARSWYAAFFQLPALPEYLLSLCDFRALRLALNRTSRRGTFDRLMPDYVDTWRQPGALTAMLNWYRALMREPTNSAIGKQVPVPLLLLWGARDFSLTRAVAEESMQCCENGRLVYIESAGHWVLHETPEEVNEQIVAFLLEGPGEIRVGAHNRYFAAPVA